MTKRPRPSCWSRILTEQWYLNVQPLADKAIAAVEKGETKFVPENWANVYFGWLRNIRPWCISRQLWWGHQIPVWYDADGKIYCAETEAEAHEAQAGGKPLDRATTTCWIPGSRRRCGRSRPWAGPTRRRSLRAIYPTSVLVTGFDIIFFWVARMMMMGIHFLGEVPFRTVLIHNRVLDEQGAKMSKTKGNVVDPITLIDEFGADALRFTLALGGRPEPRHAHRPDAGRNQPQLRHQAVERLALLRDERLRHGAGISIRPVVSETVNKWIVAETATCRWRCH